MTEIGQRLQKHTQLSSEGFTNKKEGYGSQKEKMNTPAQTQPTKKIADPLHHISETIMV